MNYAKAYVGSVCLAAGYCGRCSAMNADGCHHEAVLARRRAGNIAVALLGKASVNLAYHLASLESIQSALKQCGCKHVITAQSRSPARLKLDPGPGVEI